MSDKAVITCALTGVLTDPRQHPVPVTPEQMAREAKAAFDAGAAVMHVHFRQQAPGKGHLPSWEPERRRNHHAGDPRRLPGRDPQRDDRHARAGHFRAARLPARRQAGDRRLQCRLAELSESARRRIVGVAAARVRQSGRESESLSRRDARDQHAAGIRMFRRRHRALRRHVRQERHVRRPAEI